MNFSLKNNYFLQTLIVGLVLYGLWKIKLIIILVFIAFLLSTIFYPVIALLKARRWPTALAIIVPITLIIIIVGGLFYLLLPPFLDRLADFAKSLPQLVDHASSRLHLNVKSGNFNNLISTRLGGFSHFAFAITTTAAKILAGTLTIIVLTIYWLGSYETVKKEILSYFHGKRRERLADIWSRIEIKLRHWIKAHLILNTVVALLVWITMTIEGVPFAGLLAFIAFLIEIIPTAGPIIASIPAIVLGLSESLVKGLVVAITYLVIQQIESHLLSPLLLGKTVRLHPIVIILSLLLGYEVYGILGSFISVPFALCVSAITDSFRGRPQPPSNQILKNTYSRAKQYLRLG